MRFKTLRTALAVGAIAVASGYAVQVSAALLTFTQVAGFIGTGPGSATPGASIDYTTSLSGVTYPLSPVCALPACYNTNPISDPNAPAATVFQRMSWLKGTSPQSDLIITNRNPMAPFDGLNSSGGNDLPWTTITTLTQHNNIIPGPLSWDNQSILGRLQIFDGATKVLDNTGTDTLSFVETFNNGFDGTGTPDPTKCGPPNPLGSQCDDFFTFMPGSLAPLMFTAVDGTKYLVEFRLANFINAGFDPANPDNGVVYTAEASTASLDVQIRLTVIPTTTVPEPGTLTLLGVALLALGFAGWRCRQR